jgi:hypothetical protein
MPCCIQSDELCLVIFELVAKHVCLGSAACNISLALVQKLSDTSICTHPAFRIVDVNVAAPAFILCCDTWRLHTNL